MQAVLDLIWDKLLPALKPSPLPANEEARNRLVQKLKGLTLAPATGSATAARGWERRFEFPTNRDKLESIMLQKTGEEGAMTLVARFEGREQKIVCGRGTWHTGRGRWTGPREQPLAASGAWTQDDTFTAKLCFFETPFCSTIRLKFSGDEVRYLEEVNVGFGARSQAPLVGKAANP